MAGGIRTACAPTTSRSRRVLSPSPRSPYRPALSVAHALAELERCAGSQFDPSLARTFVDGWERGKIAPAGQLVGIAI